MPGNTHGYMFNHGGFTLFDVPGAVFTVAIDVNSHGSIVGRYNTPDAGRTAISWNTPGSPVSTCPAAV